MKKFSTLALVVCLVLSGAWSYAHGMAMRIYPNPTNDMFFVSTAGNNAGGTMKATLVSATGAVLEVRYLNGSEESFDLTGEASGIYLLEIGNGNEKHVWKIIKR